MHHRPIKAGITGGIGAGKTLVANVFKVLGVPVYNADLRARQLMSESEDVAQMVVENFGEACYAPDGSLDRSYLAKVVFADEKKLQKLNAIVHPAVYQDFNHWYSQKNSESYVLMESALMIETGSYKKLDYVMAVTAPESVRIERVAKRDRHRSMAEIRDIIAKQLPEEQKAGAAQFVIMNDGFVLLIPQILKIHKFFTTFRQKGL
jgi:dephospho-CoA kinase